MAKAKVAKGDASAAAKARAEAFLRLPEGTSYEDGCKIVDGTKSKKK